LRPLDLILFLTGYSLTKMTKLYFIRHGEAEHNIGAKLYGDSAYDMPQFWNPSLTDKGIKQAAHLQTIIDLHDKAIIVSPLQRALETAAEGFPGSTFHIDDRVSEFNPAWRCNRRIDAVTLKDEWPSHIINCSAKTPTAEESYDELNDRVRQFINHMKGQEDTIIVSHYDFITAAFKQIGYDNNGKINHCHPYIIEI
jgi:broad specificity phosphatase PhoE